MCRSRMAGVSIQRYVAGAQILQLLEVRMDLIDRSLAGEPLITVNGTISNAKIDPWTERWNGTFFLYRNFTESWDPFLQPGEADVDRMPRVSKTNGPSHRCVTVAADPDRGTR